MVHHHKSALKFLVMWIPLSVLWEPLTNVIKHLANIQPLFSILMLEGPENIPYKHFICLIVTLELSLKNWTSFDNLSSLDWGNETDMVAALKTIPGYKHSVLGNIDFFQMTTHLHHSDIEIVWNLSAGSHSKVGWQHRLGLPTK